MERLLHDLDVPHVGCADVARSRLAIGLGGDSCLDLFCRCRRWQLKLADSWRMIQRLLSYVIEMVFVFLYNWLCARNGPVGQWTGAAMG